MPVSLSFSEPSTFNIDAAGAVTYAESVEVLDQLVTHPRLRDDARIVVDGRRVTKVPTTGELRALALALEKLSERSVVSMAIVTGSTFVYGVARMFSVFAEVANVKVSVFQDVKEAERWKPER